VNTLMYRPYTPGSRHPAIPSGVSLFLTCGAAGSALSLLLRIPGLCCVAGLLEAALALVLDWAVVRRLWTGRSLMLGRVFLIVVIVVGMSLLMRPTPAKLFEQAFGVVPPDNVRNLSGVIGFGGGFTSDMTANLHFSADAPTVQSLLAVRGFVGTRQQEIDELRRGTMTWPEFRSAVFGVFGSEAYVGKAWGTVPPMKDPRVYKWERHHDGVLTEDVILLWDAATGEVFVIYGKP
jgi:hypothetical protein